MIILLDNGHGIDTPGKMSPVWSDGRQLFEWKFNRELVKSICETLKVVGIKSFILVPEEADIPISERCRRVNFFNTSDDYFLISVHANAGKGSGWEIWTSKAETKSDILAEYFCNSAREYLTEFPMRFLSTFPGEGRDKDADFAILHHTRCPAVLTENLFMDNEKDCIFIMSRSGKEILTDLHIDAIQKIIRDNNLNRL
jgi:N-acetylmuramoyl-L-alanine amidase